MQVFCSIQRSAVTAVTYTVNLLVTALGVLQFSDYSWGLSKTRSQCVINVQRLIAVKFSNLHDESHRVASSLSVLRPDTCSSVGRIHVVVLLAA